jgi:hypothetical protein
LIRLTNIESALRKVKKDGKRKHQQQQQHQSGGVRCAVCAYRILTPDVCLDVDFTGRVRNGRPEECWRVRYEGNWVNTYVSEGKEQEGGEGEDNKRVGGEGVYAGGVVKGGRVLTIGDGDLSFSVGVRRLLMKGDRSSSSNSPKKSKTSSSSSSSSSCSSPFSVTATSYEKLSTLSSCYSPSLISGYVQELGTSNVRFQVDGTDIEGTLGEEGGTAGRFDSVVWNFPCTAEEKGQDGQNNEMDRNKEMLKAFSASVVPALTPGGEVVISHKTKPPYNQWDVTGILEASGPLRCRGRVVLDRSVFKPYINRKALDRKSFTCHDAEFYVFGKEGEEEGEEEGWGERRGLVRIDEDMIRLIREGFMG